METNNALPQTAKLTTRIALSATEPESCHHILSALLMASSNSSGFLTAEITPPPTENNSEWVIAQCFRTTEQATAWQESEERRKIIDQLAPHKSNVLDEVTPHSVDATVAAAITSQIQPGTEAAYYEWLHKIQTEQSKFPGYRGTYLQPPTNNTTGDWMTLLRFSTPESLDNWLNSKNRRELMEESKRLLRSERLRVVKSSFPGFVPFDPETQQAPANYKVAMLVLLGIYPVVMLQTRFVAPYLASWKAPLSFLFLNATGVALLTWLTMPFMQRIFIKWLIPKDENRRTVEVLGILLIVALYGLEAMSCWNLF